MRILLPDEKLKEWLTACINQSWMKNVTVSSVCKRETSWVIDLKETGSSKGTKEP